MAKLISFHISHVLKITNDVGADDDDDEMCSFPSWVLWMNGIKIKWREPAQTLNSCQFDEALFIDLRICCSSTSSSPTAHHVYRRTNAPMLMCFNHYHTTVKNCLSLFTFLLFFLFFSLFYLHWNTQIICVSLTPTPRNIYTPFFAHTKNCQQK